MEYNVKNDTLFESIQPSKNCTLILLPMDPWRIQLPLTVIYLFIFVIGFIGNLCTCFVIKCNKKMHTTANYYLFNLAISDLLLISIDPLIHVIIIWYRCLHSVDVIFIFYFFSSALVLMITTISVLTMTLFTIERYVAICHIFYAHKTSSPRRVIISLILVWIFSICFTVLEFYFAPKYKFTTVWAAVILCYIIPLILLAILYTRIILYLRRTKNIRKFSKQTEDQQNSKTIKILVAIVIAFFICWTPYNVQILNRLYNFINPPNEILKAYLHLLSSIIQCVSACINPILYNIISNKFRRSFKETLSRYLNVTNCEENQNFQHSLSDGGHIIKQDDNTRTSLF